MTLNKRMWTIAKGDRFIVGENGDAGPFLYKTQGMAEKYLAPGAGERVARVDVEITEIKPKRKAKA